MQNPSQDREQITRRSCRTVTLYGMTNCRADGENNKVQIKRDQQGKYNL